MVDLMYITDILDKLPSIDGNKNLKIMDSFNLHISDEKYIQQVAKKKQCDNKYSR